MRRPALLFVATGFMLLLLAGCEWDDPVGPFAHSVTERDIVFNQVSGNNQTGVVGQELPALLVGRLTDSDGNPRVGHMVRWVIIAGDGAVWNEFTVTDADGMAANRWKLGPKPGTNAVELRSVSVVRGDEWMHGTFIATGVVPD